MKQTIEEILSGPGMARIRELSDPSHPDYDPAWTEPHIRICARLMRGMTPVQLRLADHQRIQACEHWSRPDCGCQQGVCGPEGKRPGLVSFVDCLDCLGVFRGPDCPE